jgi:hypothetical protein
LAGAAAFDGLAGRGGLHPGGDQQQQVS